MRINRNDLVNAVEIAKKFAGSTSLAVTNSVCISAKHEAVIGSDMTNFCLVPIEIKDATGSDDGCCINPKMLLDILKKSGDPEIELGLDFETHYVKPDEIGDTSISYREVSLAIGPYRGLHVQPPEDFPDVPEIGQTFTMLDLDKPDVLKMWMPPGLYQEEKDTRAHTNACYFDGPNNQMVSTDGSCLYSVPLEILTDDQLLIEKATLKKVALLAESVVLDHSYERWSRFSIKPRAKYGTDPITVYTRPFDSDFPTYHSLVDDLSRTDFVEVNTADLKRALEQALVVRSKAYRGVIMTINEENINFRSSNPDVGEFEKPDVKCDGRIPNEPFEIGVDAELLIHAIKTGVKNGKTCLGFGRGSDDAIHVNGGDETFKGIVMPMRV